MILEKSVHKAKGIPQKIFVVVLISGIISIIGELVLMYNISRLSSNYKIIVDEHTINRIYMSDISALAYRHQSVVAKHLFAEDEEQYDTYEKECETVKEELMSRMVAFEKRMSGDKREQLYHKVYSNINSYLSNADIGIKLSRDGSKSTAYYYYDTIMSEFLSKVDSSIYELDEYTEAQMSSAREDMDQYLERSKAIGIICMICIAAATLICLVYCVRITANLDKYKDNLEKEVKDQTEELRKHNEKMLSIQNNTILGMANLIENRDGDTGEHIKRTSYYVEVLANAAKNAGYYRDILTDDYIELLVKAAPMHDIGKIAVPDNILKKPGKLTDKEYEEMKKHAESGGRIVREVLENIEESEYVDIAAAVASGHHEKWDGTGYPEGLSGEDIPICARIMAIADVYDALVSDRCYKKAMSEEEAFKIIEESAGTHFDPELARLFLASKEQVSYHNQYNNAAAS